MQIKQSTIDEVREVGERGRAVYERERAERERQEELDDARAAGVDEERARCLAIVAKIASVRRGPGESNACSDIAEAIAAPVGE